MDKNADGNTKICFHDNRKIYYLLIYPFTGKNFFVTLKLLRNPLIITKILHKKFFFLVFTSHLQRNCFHFVVWRNKQCSLILFFCRPLGMIFGQKNKTIINTGNVYRLLCNMFPHMGGKLLPFSTYIFFFMLIINGRGVNVSYCFLPLITNDYMVS